MSRKEEVAADLMGIMKTVYKIHPLSDPSDKQKELINSMVDYLEASISLRRKRKDDEDKELAAPSIPPTPMPSDGEPLRKTGRNNV